MNRILNQGLCSNLGSVICQLYDLREIYLTSQKLNFLICKRGSMRGPISGDSESIKFSNTGKALSKVHIKHSITSIDVAVLLFTDPFFTVPLSPKPLHQKPFSMETSPFCIFNLYNNSTIFLLTETWMSLVDFSNLLLFYLTYWQNLYFDHSFLLEKTSSFGFGVIISQLAS